MFNWFSKLFSGNPLPLVKDGLPTLSACKTLRDKWWHNFFSGGPEYGSFAPSLELPSPFNEVFDFVVAQKIVCQWVKIHGATGELHWGSLSKDVGAHTEQTLYTFLGFKYLAKAEIILNDNHIRYRAADNPEWWSILVHEMGHVPVSAKGHQVDSYGLHLVRAKLYLENKLEVVVAKRNFNKP